MFKYELTPAIIAGLKSEADLDLLLDCLDKRNLDNFKPFKIVFEYNPVLLFYFPYFSHFLT